MKTNTAAVAIIATSKLTHENIKKDFMTLRIPLALVGQL